MRRRTAAALGALVALILPACGYRTGLTLPEGTRTVGVEIFGNDSKLRDLERAFHEAITDSLTERVDAPLVPPREAQVVVRGRVVSYTRRGGIRNTDNQLLESGVAITVEARLERDGPQGPEVLAATVASSESGYVLDRPPPPNPPPFMSPQQSPAVLGDTPSELDARDRVIRNLADRVVLDLFASMAYESRP